MPSSTIANQPFFRPMLQPPSRSLLQGFYEDAGWSLREDGKFKSAIKANPMAHWVSVEIDKVKIGIARLDHVPPEDCYVSNLVIKHQYRGRGIGRWFLKNIEIHCAKLGIKRLLLVPETRNLPFYKALSFAPDPLVNGLLKKEIKLFQLKRPFVQNSNFSGHT